MPSGIVDGFIRCIRIGYILFLQQAGASGAIHLAADNRYEELLFKFGNFILKFSGIGCITFSHFRFQFTYLPDQIFIDIVYLIREIFDAVHNAVVGNSHAAHAVLPSFVDYFLNRAKSV